MFVKVKRFFISSVFGNVEEGQILKMSDLKAKQLIQAGIAVAHTQVIVSEVEASSFISPVEADQNGLSSPVDQASQSTIASESGNGEKKVTYRKRQGKSQS